MKKKRAVVFLAWGKRHVNQVFSCIKESKLSGYSLILITDHSTWVPEKVPGLEIVRADFLHDCFLRKAELSIFLPKGYDSYLFLDSDTVVIEDISFGFEKAEIHGIALATATHYSLDHFWNAGDVMRKEELGESGQLQYNSGVMFFALTDRVIDVFNQWRELAEWYRNEMFDDDQSLLSIAMEKLNFSPYTLSRNYNYRYLEKRIPGEPISGVVRIWHSHSKVPRDINVFETTWPPRSVVKGKMVHLASDTFYCRFPILKKIAQAMGLHNMARRTNKLSFVQYIMTIQKRTV